MPDLSDILGKRPEESGERIEIDGMCEECYWPLSHGFYDTKHKKLKMVCVKQHETTIDWEMDG